MKKPAHDEEDIWMRAKVRATEEMVAALELLQQAEWPLNPAVIVRAQMHNGLAAAYLLVLSKREKVGSQTTAHLM